MRTDCNFSRSGGDAINVTDLRLKFYLGNMLIGSIDGSQNFDNSFPCNGFACFVFRVDDAQQPYVQGLLNRGNIRFALESTLTGSSGGPETFRIVSLSTPQSVPDGGATLLLLSAALGALGSVRRFVQG